MIPKRVFSGIQPTGIPHIGNYLGAIKNWVKLQNEAEGKSLVMFCVVDLHSTTTQLDPLLRNKNIFQMLASLLACGIDPKKSLVFQQSRVPYHTELSWYLGCLTSTGELNRMHQWKTKHSDERNLSNLGLFSYPVLMAADILLYKSTHVPVGDDQRQHIGLTRSLAVAFNKKYSKTFPVPEAMMTDASRIMSLRNPLNKMSKSDESVMSRIDLIDTADDISMKITKAITDSEPYITDLDNRPGVKNLVSIYSAFSGLSAEDVINKYKGIQYFTAPMKSDLKDIIIDHLQPIQAEYNLLTSHRDYLEQVLIEGSEKATDIAKDTINDVHIKFGLR